MSRRQPPKAHANESADNRTRPRLLAAVAAMLVVQIILPGDSVTSASGAGVPLAMIWTLLLVAYAALVLWRNGRPIRFGKTDAAVFVLISIHTISGIWATHHGAPRPAINMTWEWIGLGCCFFLLRQLISRSGEARAVIALMIALAVGQFGLSMYQVGYEQPQSRAAYAADADKHFRQATAADPASRIDPLFQLEFKARLLSDEPVGTFLLANSLAGFLAPWLVVAFGLAIVHGNGTRRWSLSGIGLVVAVVLIAATVVLAESRTAIVATLAGIGLCLRATVFNKLFNQLMRTGNILVGILFVGVVLLLTLAVIQSDNPRLAAAKTSLQYRLEYWQATGQMIAERPLLGCGPGNFADIYTAHKLPQSKEEVGDPHNFLLEIWSTAGSFAAIAFLATFGCFAIRSLAAVKSREPSDHGDLNNNSSGGANYVLIGGAIGIPLAWLLGNTFASILESSITTTALAVFAAGFVIVALLLRGWVLRGRLPVWLPLTGVLVLLVHLLGAGGIGNHGVAASLWVLLALGLNLADQFRGGRNLSKAATVGVVTAALVVAFVCQRTAYSPVVKSKSALAAARAARISGQREAFQQSVLLAAAADPLAVEPARLQALNRLRIPGKTNEQMKYFDHNMSWHRNAPNRAATYREIGNRYLSAYAVARQSKSKLEAAIREYREAIRCYPNNAILHAHLAWACNWNGDVQAAVDHAAEALRLDNLNPHPDYKLASGNFFFADPTVQPRTIRKEMETLADRSGD